MRLYRKPSPRRYVKVFLFVLSIAVVWFSARFLPGIAGDAALYIERPVRVAAGYVVGAMNSLRGFFVSHRELRNTKEHLERENAALRETVAELDTLRVENEGLRLLAQHAAALAGETPVAARVVGKGAHVFGQTLYIDKGSKAGIHEGDVVIAGKRNLVGRIGHVTAYHAEVLLPSNRTFRSAVKILPNTQEGNIAKSLVALARGEGLGNTVVDMIPAEAVFTGAETVLTSGFDGIYPPGLVMGKIGKVLSGPSDFFGRAELEQVIDIGGLETVLVLPHDA
jgi:rod shape-determining protein MreC